MGVYTTRCDKIIYSSRNFSFRRGREGRKESLGVGYGVYVYCFRLTSIFLVLCANSVDTHSFYLEGSGMGMRGRLNEKGGGGGWLVVMKGRE